MFFVRSSLIFTTGRSLIEDNLMTMFRGFEVFFGSLFCLKSFVRLVPIPEKMQEIELSDEVRWERFVPFLSTHRILNQSQSLSNKPEVLDIARRLDLFGGRERERETKERDSRQKGNGRRRAL